MYIGKLYVLKVNFLDKIMLLISVVLEEVFDVSNHEGNFEEDRLHESTDLVMFAAGTGFTPMAGLLYQATAVYPKHNRYVHCMVVCVNCMYKHD